ncbi:MAG TPA: RsbRD N-terminal domain-containing protein [Candidatus Sulfopaludibacter sp.]|nr:RsbRD N-terminal domain-containing protein [Candidatus Sulfopaludibacter sp.]
MASREGIVELWLWRALRTYPRQTAQFLAREPDRFRNPVGHTLREALGILLEEALEGTSPERAAAALDSIAQIRAVENCPPGRAFDFLFQLKAILRGQHAEEELSAPFSRIDQLALQGFDTYMKYREKTYEARANEARRRVFVLERRLAPESQPVWQGRGDK